MELFWSVVQSVLAWFPKLWDLEIVQQQGHPITLGQLVIVLFLLVVGYFLSKKLSRLIGKRILTRLDIEESLRYTFQTVIFYVLLVILTLFVLGLLNVPLTVFTVLGSTFAIGVGFGAQKIINNFISGLIIMVERPVRVGDIIEVDGLKGTVEHIGARATRVKSLDNTHIVVPNSSFLENNVLNWTLSDDVVRSKIVVGIAYGSDTRVAEALLKKAISEHERVLKYPEVQVLFSEFGDNALNFIAYFWSRVPNVGALMQVESDIRFRVDELFRESEVVIAFPQRDVHIDSLSPIQVELKKD